MNFFIISIVAFLTGIIASMGLGGGMVLIIYLAISTSITQIEAQGINLVFFLSIAIVSLIIHTHNELIEWKKIIPAIITGIIGVFFGGIIASNINSQLLTKIFALFIIIIGIKEFLTTKNH